MAQNGQMPNGKLLIYYYLKTKDSKESKFKKVKKQTKRQNQKSEKNQKSERKENPSFFFLDFSFSHRPSLLLQPRRVAAQPALDALSLKSMLSPSLCQRAALSPADVASGTVGSGGMLVDFYFQFFIASLLWICGYKL